MYVTHSLFDIFGKIKMFRDTECGMMGERGTCEMRRQEDKNDLVKRVQQMERYFDEVSRVLELKSNELYENDTISKMIQELTVYMGSGLWLQDYERDERGELPKDLKRGVLSEDGLYNLLSDIESDCCPKCKRIIIDSSSFDSNLE